MHSHCHISPVVSDDVIETDDQLPHKILTAIGVDRCQVSVFVKTEEDAMCIDIHHSTPELGRIVDVSLFLCGVFSIGISTCR